MLIIKPDAFDRELVGEILSYFEKWGYLREAYVDTFSIADCNIHYAAHIGKPFFPNLERHMISGKSMFIKMDMPYNDARELALKIRNKYGVEGPRNLIHASDSAESDAAETEYWFNVRPIRFR